MSTKYNTYLGQPKSVHDWVFFWSHYICGYWKVYYSVYHSQPLESCCQSKRKPWEMFSHQQETTYNICKSSIQRNLYYMQADTVCIELVALIWVTSSDLSCHQCLLCYYDQLVLFNKEIHANIVIVSRSILKRFHCLFEWHLTHYDVIYWNLY